MRRTHERSRPNHAPARWLALTAAAGMLSVTGCTLIDDIRGDGASSGRAEATASDRRSAERSSPRSASRTDSRAANRSGSRDADADENLLETRVRNGSPWAWVVTLRSGIRAQTGTAVQNRVTGERVLVGPDQVDAASVRRQPSWFVTDRDHADEVVRVRVERRVETWSDPEVFWFEVLGPLPAQITISSPAREDGRVIPRLVGASPATPIAAVPQSRYPHEDR